MHRVSQPEQIPTSPRSRGVGRAIGAFLASIVVLYVNAGGGEWGTGEGETDIEGAQPLNPQLKKPINIGSAISEK